MPRERSGENFRFTASTMTPWANLTVRFNKRVGYRNGSGHGSAG
jgi:hypothetical protein